MVKFDVEKVKGFLQAGLTPRAGRQRLEIHRLQRQIRADDEELRLSQHI